MDLKVLQKLPPALVLVHGWLFPVFNPKPEPEPCLSVKLYCSTQKPFPQKNCRNRKPELPEPFHPQTVTEPNRTLL